jgi:hypothetical protein
MSEQHKAIIDNFLEKQNNLGQATADAAAPEQKTPLDVVKEKAEETPAEARKKAAARKEAQKPTPAEQINSPAEQALDAAADKTRAAQDWLAARPTPGGLLLLFGILLFFIWVIVPVNGGKTRLELLWLTITGKTRLPADASAADQQAIIDTLDGRAQTPQQQQHAQQVAQQQAQYAQANGTIVQADVQNILQEMGIFH